MHFQQPLPVHLLKNMLLVFIFAREFNLQIKFQSLSLFKIHMYIRIKIAHQKKAHVLSKNRSVAVLLLLS